MGSERHWERAARGASGDGSERKEEGFGLSMAEHFSVVHERCFCAPQSPLRDDLLTRILLSCYAQVRPHSLQAGEAEAQSLQHGQREGLPRLRVSAESAAENVNALPRPSPLPLTLHPRAATTTTR